MGRKGFLPKKAKPAPARLPPSPIVPSDDHAVARTAGPLVGHSRPHPLLVVMGCVLLATWVWAGFGGMWHHEFLDWDDKDYLTTNIHYRGLNRACLTWMFSAPHFGHYHPITWISYALDYSIWGMTARGYFLTNIMLHTCNGILLWGIALRLRAYLAPSAPPGQWVYWTWCAVALFVVHPLRAEAVCWASNRKELLGALFLIVSLHAYLTAVRAKNAMARPGENAPPPLAICLPWLWCSGVCFWLALFSKATALLFPVLLLILDIWPLRRLRISWDVSRSGWHHLARAIGEKSIHLAASAVVMVLAPWAQTSAGASVSIAEHGLGARGAQLMYALVYYPAKTFWPQELCALYLLPEQLSPFHPVYFGCGLMVITTVFLIWRWRGRFPGFAVLALASFLLLLPVSGLAQAGMQLVADRYSYLPAMVWAVGAGCSLSIVTSVNRGLQAVPSPRGGPAVHLYLAPFVMGLMFLSWWYTVPQVSTWRDTTSVWKHAVKVCPDNYVAWNNLGTIFLKNADTAQAHACFQRAHQAGPRYLLAMVNLAAMEVANGRFDEGIRLYRAVLDIDHNQPDTLFNLGNVLARADQHHEAIICYQQAQRLRPEDERIAHNHARVLLLTKQPKAALIIYERLCKNNSTTMAEEGRGHALSRLDQYHAAIVAFQNAIAIGDASPSAYLGLAQAHERVGNRSQCLEVLHSGIQAWPRDITLHLQCARQEVLRENWSSALTHVEKVCQLGNFQVSDHVQWCARLAEKAGNRSLAERCREHLTRITQTASPSSLR